jgi:hypothetical protein
MSTYEYNRHPRPIPLLLWPFWAIWKFVALIVVLTGRLVAVAVGVALLIAGVAVSVTVIGAIVGVPLAILGFLLIMRGLF